MYDKRAARLAGTPRRDASAHVRTLLERNIEAGLRGQPVEKAERSWTTKRRQGRILWIKKLTR
jgi:hypothetical protein